MRCYDYSAYLRRITEGLKRHDVLPLVYVVAFVAVACALGVAAFLVSAALPPEKTPPWEPGFSTLFTFALIPAIVAVVYGRYALSMLFGGLGATAGDVLILAYGPFTNPTLGAEELALALLRLPIGPVLLIGAVVARRAAPPRMR